MREIRENDIDADIDETDEAPAPETWRERLTRVGRQTGQRLRKVAPFATGVLVAFVALWLYNVVSPPPPPLTQREVNDTIAKAMASATPAPAYSAGVYQAIMPSLVFIETELAEKDEDGKDKSALGSGVVINEEGAILTSLHVVSGSTSIKLTFADGTESAAKIINKQPENDIAVLQPSNPPKQIVPAVLGNPGAMRVGDEAYVVGNPLGLYGSMSAGVISGLNRSFRPEKSGTQLKGLIQFDAAANPGNSGGPLLNRYGQVIGIVTALVNPTGQDVFIGIAFAVPINVAGGGAGMPPY